MTFWIIVTICVAFISGFLAELEFRTKKDLDDMLNNCAETERLRTENKYLKDKLANGK